MKTTHGMVLQHTQKNIAEVINLAVTFDSDLNPTNSLHITHCLGMSRGSFPKGDKCKYNYYFEQSLNNYKIKFTSHNHC